MPRAFDSVIEIEWKVTWAAAAVTGWVAVYASVAASVSKTAMADAGFKAGS